MCYAGDVDSAIEYFKNIGFDCPDHENPAEYFIDLVTIDSEDTVQAALDKTRINLLHHRFLESCTAVSSQLSSTNNKTIMKQQQTRTNRLMMLSPRSITKSVRRFGALLRRSWRQNIRNTPIIVIRLGASIAQAALFSSSEYMHIYTFCINQVHSQPTDSIHICTGREIAYKVNR